ncbi:hypothetical protein WICPIJ_002677 [Wickerhamomyces pijperi]|uniref:Enoyl-CoA hydratase n=1 Tax=Wickerhamomyces pijperi TaxID=599730 RepID=A0A9P8TPK3_WICPI|nr:hypothetical protein WICPIJ_002677 [Wickerhamomyces pijperi]
MNTSPLSNYETILTSTPHPGLLLILLNRPKSLNSINPTLINDLSHALNYANDHPELYGVVIIGSSSPGVFCAGADVKTLVGLSPEELRLQKDKYDMRKIYQGLDIPVLAAVNGLCYGGGLEIALMCDVVYCSDSTFFALPEIKLGIFPGGGATQRLPGIIGKSKALELILTGKEFSAYEAEKWGIVSKVIPNLEDEDEDEEEEKEEEEMTGSSQVLKEALKLGQILADGPRMALRMAKRATLSSCELPLSLGVKRERSIFNGLFGKPEQTEGMEAFVGKRKANFNKL